MTHRSKGSQRLVGAWKSCYADPLTHAHNWKARWWVCRQRTGSKALQSPQLEGAGRSSPKASRESKAVLKDPGEDRFLVV